jgi:hypothetical protein
VIKATDFVLTRAASFVWDRRRGVQRRDQPGLVRRSSLRVSGPIAPRQA